MILFKLEYLKSAGGLVNEILSTVSKENRLLFLKVSTCQIKTQGSYTLLKFGFLTKKRWTINTHYIELP